MTMKSEYLSDYTDVIETLPLEIRRNYTLIRQLDENAQELMTKVEHGCEQLTGTASLPKAKKKELLDEIGHLLNEALKRGEEKFALAKSTYDAVDRQCTRLDNDLQRFEDEHLIGPSASQPAGESSAPTTPVRTNAERSPKRRKGHAARRTSRKKREGNTSESGYSPTDAILHAQTAVSLSDLPIDPNEPLYCYCRQVSFGEMVACDNDECEIEWFHLECVGLQNPPKGIWYCANCQAEMKGKKL